MDLGVSEPTAPVLNPVDHALDQLTVGLDHLVKLVEDGGLDHFDDTGFIGFLQSFEKVRNRLSLVDHVSIAAVEARDLPQKLCQGSTRRVLTSALRISKAEAARRVRGPPTRSAPESRCSGSRWRRCGRIWPERNATVS